MRTSENNIALVSGDLRMTYIELFYAVHNIRIVLKSKGLNKGDRIALYMDRSVDWIASALACLKEEICFVPLDISWPDSRIKKVIEKAQVTLVLSNQETAIFSNTLQIDIQLPLRQPLDHPVFEKPLENLNPDALAYLLFTSGSTGEPKGVLIRVNSFLNYLHSADEVYGKKMPNHFPLFTSLGFDLTLTSVFLPLFNGGTIWIYPSRDIFKVVEDIWNNASLTHIKLTPSHFQFLPKRRSEISVVIVGGEALEYEILKENRDYFAEELVFFNEYGPTEATIGCSIFKVRDLNQSGPVPLGQAIKGGKFKVDKQTSELWIGGEVLSPGYWNSPEKTAASFFEDKLGQRWYKSGDKVEIEGENLFFAGRLNSEVKIYGHRIDLQEIASIIKSVEGVVDAHVLLSKADDHSLFAMIKSTSVSKQEIKQKLILELPHYAQPNQMIIIDTFPINRNGKIDFKRLIKESKNDFEFSSDPKEMLKNLWKNELELELISEHDNFFTLGGDSISLVALNQQIQDSLKIELSIIDLYRNLTFYKMLTLISGKVLNNELKHWSPKQNYPDRIELNNFQKELFTWMRTFPNSTAYNETLLLPLPDEVDLNRLNNLCRNLVANFEMFSLQLEINADKPIFELHKAPNIHLEVVEYESLTKACETMVQPFGTNEFLYRFSVIQCNSTKYLFLDIHHLISDYRAEQLLIKVFAQGLEDGTYQPPKVGHIKVNHWAYTGGKDYNRIFWSNQLENTNTRLTFTHHENTKHRRAKLIEASIGQHTIEKIKAFCHLMQITVTTYYLGVFLYTLSKFVFETKFAVGVPMSLRDQKSLNTKTGPLLNTLPITYSTNKSIGSFSEYLNQISDDFWETFAHRSTFLSDIIANTGLEVNEDGFLYDVIFVLQNELKEVSTSLSKVNLEQKEAKTKLLCEIVPGRNSNAIHFYYMPKYLSKELMDSLSASFIFHLEKSINVSDIGWQHELAERNSTFWQAVNQSAELKSTGQTMVDYFLQSVNKFGDKVALLDNHREITFRQIDDWSNQIAAEILTHAKGSSQIVAVLLNRSIEMIVSVLGIWKSGKAYAPLNPSDPLASIQGLIQQMNPEILISNHPIDFFKGHTLRVDQSLRDQAYEAVNHAVSDDPAYVIFTSGSTGKPKGVVVEHAAILNRMEWAQEHFKVTTSETILHKTPLSFDVSVWELLSWVIPGARLAILPSGDERIPEKITAAISRFRINHIHFVPSMLSLYLSFLKSSSELKTLRQIYCSGESLMPSDVKLFYSTLGDEYGVKISNLYGPTEAAVDVSCFDVDRPDLYYVPIGKSISNVQLQVFRDMILAPPYGLGEIFIAGKGLARAYLNDFKKTKEAFIMHRNKTRYYRTGDLGFADQEGNFYYLGRKDQQVKIGGVRIELAGIKSWIKEKLSLNLVEVFVHPKHQTLCCALNYDELHLHGLDINRIKIMITEGLAENHRPDKYFVFDTFKYTESGKLDIKSLIKNSSEEIKTLNIYEQLTKLQQTAFEIIKDQLQSHNLALKDNYFTSGGTSLMLISLADQLQQRIHKRISIADVYKNPSIYSILMQLETSPVSDNFWTIIGEKNQALLFCFPPAAGFGITYQSMAGLLDGYCIVAFDFIESDDYIQLLKNAIISLQPAGEFTFLGYSGGGNIAFNVSKELEKEGRSISKIIMIDAYARKDKYDKLTKVLESLKTRLIDRTYEQLKEVPFDLVSSKIDAYYQYFWLRNREAGQINAPIVLIKSPLSDLIEITQNKDDLVLLDRDWKAYTNGAYVEYLGAGTHQTMMDSPHIEKNSTYIAQALKSVFTI